MELLELVDEFGAYVDERSAAVFVGAGLSVPAGFPSWSDLTAHFLTELGLKSMDDLPQLAQYYEDDAAGNRQRINQHVVSTMRAVKKIEPTRAHLLLNQLPIDEFWTTNYDGLLEAAISNAYAYEADEALAGPAPPNRRSIYKMHGSIGLTGTTPKRLVPYNSA